MKATRKSCKGKTSVEVVESVETGLPEKMRQYNAWIGGIARRYKQSQVKAATAVNVEMLKFYWSLGADIVRLEKDQPWGSKFMLRISADLKAWMPDAKCFSVRNLQYMRLFVELYGTREIAQQPVAQLERAEISQQLVAQTGIAAASVLKQPSDLQTVGLIICREKDRVTVQYALESSALPIGVSDYVLERFIPAGFKSQMPSIEEVESELTRRLEIAEEVRKGKR